MMPSTSAHCLAGDGFGDCFDHYFFASRCPSATSPQRSRLLFAPTPTTSVRVRVDCARQFGSLQPTRSASCGDLWWWWWWQQQNWRVAEDTTPLPLPSGRRRLFVLSFLRCLRSFLHFLSNDARLPCSASFHSFSGRPFAQQSSLQRFKGKKN